MKVKCCVCEKVIREKPPFDNNSITYTYCDECYQKEMKKIRKWKRMRRKMKGDLSVLHNK